MDNFYKMCPPMMQDQGRHLSDFQTATRRNEYIKYMNGVWRDDQYRSFLQSNAKVILDREWDYHKTHNKCWENECVHNYPTRMSPRLFQQEREAYDSKYNPNTNKSMAHMRKCNNYKDYRMY